VSKRDWTPSAIGARAGFTAWVDFAELEPALETIPTSAAGLYLLFRRAGRDPPA
jgi:hypothetical protein